MKKIIPEYEDRKTICPVCGDNRVINHTLNNKVTCVGCGFQFENPEIQWSQCNIKFRAETLDGEIIEACCVINKPKHLFLSNEANPGTWTRCKQGTLGVTFSITEEGAYNEKI